MQPITKEQRRALKRIYDRTPLYDRARLAVLVLNSTNQLISGDKLNYFRLSYRDFRRRVVEGSDCIMIEWCGLWLGIEKDGYTHS